MFQNSIGICILLGIRLRLSSSELFCPPLVPADNPVDLTCVSPDGNKNYDCSSSWIPVGTIARYECTSQNGKVRRGRIICNGIENENISRSSNNSELHHKEFPCGLREDSSSSAFHLYGHEKPMHYQIPNKYLSARDYHSVGLNLINSFRQKHNATDLLLDEALSKRAKTWAMKLVSQSTSLDLAPEKFLGQNIFSSDQINEIYAINDAIQNWYHSGIHQYNWKDIKRNWNNSLALDFSQIVWKNTKHVGFGVSSVPDGTPTRNSRRTVVVAFFFPMGNIVVEDDTMPEKLFIENVIHNKLF